MKKEEEIKKSIIKWRVKVVWIGLGIFTLLLRFLFGLNPKVTESIYSRGIFQGIRFCLDYTLGLISFPLVYLIAAALMFFLALKIARRIKRSNRIKEKILWQVRLLNGVLYLAALFGAVVFLFYFLWGFNYQRLPIEDHLKIKPEPLDIDGIREEANIAFQMVVAARKEIHGAREDPLDSRLLPRGLERKIRHNLKKILMSMGYPVSGRVRTRKFKPAGLLMSFGISGIYFPFTGESYIPANLTPLELPFTMAHEMAHGFGFTEEGTANFLAYLVCLSAKEPFIKYSGCFAYWRYVSGEILKASPEEWKDLMKKLPVGIISDIKAISQNWKLYRGWLMNVGERINDAYLKTQGVKEGVKSYNRLVVLAAAWRDAFGDQGVYKP